MAACFLPQENPIPFPQLPECGVLGCVGVCVCGLKKNAQHEICELSVTWGKMKTISLGDNLSHSLSMWG